MAVINHWDELIQFQSAEYTQAYLKNRYKTAGYDDFSAKSYENCYAFMYYLEHGEAYYRQAIQAPVSIQPVLLFYGFVHLLKACLLSVDPLYPETTSVLAHGVTSRKKKKQNYRFGGDEVKIQKMGLCAHLANKMFQLGPLEGNKYSMQSLLMQIPELDTAFPHQKHFIFVEEKGGKYLLPSKVLDGFHMTAERFSNYLAEKMHGRLEGVGADEGGVSFSCGEFLPLPFRFHLFKKQFCFPFKMHKENDLPDILVHYLLLYNLSMISRYETEWWAELLKSRETSDFPAITLFLHTAMEKGPFLCLQFLTAKNE
ncbi:hypothetical protein BpPP18_31880 [Weizmannia acidilactici]|nr:hypothetical protein BpPP18_31880 [Weizmannia acidilactici]